MLTTLSIQTIFCLSHLACICYFLSLSTTAPTFVSLSPISKSFHLFSSRVWWPDGNSGTTSCPNTDAPPAVRVSGRPLYVHWWLHAIYYHSLMSSLPSPWHQAKKVEERKQELEADREDINEKVKMEKKDAGVKRKWGKLKIKWCLHHILPKKSCKLQ